MTQQAVEKTKETLEEKIELIVDSAFVQGWEAALKLSQKHSIEVQVQAILSIIDEEVGKAIQATKIVDKNMKKQMMKMWEKALVTNLEEKV